MLDAAEEAQLFAQGKQRTDLDTDRLLTHALTRVLEIVGEAAARISQQTRDSHSGIPWQQIVGLRNRLIHGYDQVDLNILWAIIQNDLPPLIAGLKQILGKDDDDTT